MKCVVVVACGLAEEPREELNGKTPLEAARTPVLDQMAARGILGLTRTIPRGAAPACEVGAASILGYDPTQHPVQAAGLEALGVGAALGRGDVALRASLVTLDATEDGSEILGDPLGGRLPLAEAAELLQDVARAVGDADVTLLPGLGHRNLLVWRGGDAQVRTVSPYELVDKPIAGRLPSGPRSDVLLGVMERAREVLASHAVCAARRARAERVPTALWPWAPSHAIVASEPPRRLRGRRCDDRRDADRPRPGPRRRPRDDRGPRRHGRPRQRRRRRGRCGARGAQHAGARRVAPRPPRISPRTPATSSAR